jgi:hypothetical protein
MSRRTKILGGLAIALLVLFVGFETEPGQRVLRDYFDVPFDPEDLLHGSAMLPAVVFLVPGLALAAATIWSKVADGRRHYHH